MCGLCCKLNEMKYGIFDFKGEKLNLKERKNKLFLQQLYLQNPGQESDKSEGENLHNYFNLHVCLSMRNTYVIRPLLQLGCAGKARIPRLSYDEIHR